MPCSNGMVCLFQVLVAGMFKTPGGSIGRKSAEQEQAAEKERDRRSSSFS